MLNSLGFFQMPTVEFFRHASMSFFFPGRPKADVIFSIDSKRLTGMGLSPLPPLERNVLPM
jgi:hypothetical protein